MPDIWIIIIIAFLAFTSGFITSFIIFAEPRKRKASGKFVIDYTNPETDVYTLEIDDDISTLPLKDYIVLDVVNKKGE